MPASSPVPKVTKRRAETRARLLAAAADTFAELGFGRSTVEDVCERAGYSRGAFYSNFSSLDELFFVMYEQRSIEVVDRASTAVDEALRAAAGAPLSVGEVMDRVLAALPVSRDSELLKLEFFAHAVRHPEVAAALVEQRRRLREELLPVLRIGLAAAGLDPDAVDLDDVARVVLALQDGLYFQELLEPGDARLETLRHHALTTALTRAATTS
ncbi:DNA-binding transcriptional regulator, AcrR family [Nakamurella panacisegetis]|uniref:DNA-binding transcriptional regulator, AcrR family n=1 Tax=Nakamurella panacisegetis TaxID=1090615 RepID=A0A1H0KEJ7_9ACTN|nr:TetR family transcriptional regulator C-terminal domain-containing protein [Nakamurella panacisegetis]SDO54240.1 DNA-binding transcriptional regulator, AcrR family [Nakamurella panacisegetis]